VSTKEPFQKLTSVGLVLAEDGRKMSKSLGNVITPDEIVKEYGADTLRLYEAFMGPFENTISWDPTSINGVYKFLNRVWELICKEEGKSVESRFEIALNKLVKKVASDIEAMKFNTAVAAAMEFINLTYHHRLTSDQKKKFLIVLAPFAPHITEELWSQIGEKYSIHKQSWPAIDNKFLEEDEVSVAVQVNGKVRDILLIQKDMISNKEVVEKMAKESQKAAKFLEGKSVKKVVYVPGKIISFVLSSS
ncbi:MAG: Leucyl-tRNA synthetase, partial [Candidatus Daviesbacteria bacterium GW2011_GWF2_38_7]